MRTKTLLLTAMIGAAGVLSSYAQSTNIYSVNVVGYTVKAGTPAKFTAIANQLTNANLTIGNLFAGIADGTIIYLWDTNTAKYGVYSYAGGNWYDDVGNTADDKLMPPGLGAFLFNDSVAVSVTFTGDVIQGNNLKVNLPDSKFAFVSSLVPTAGTLASMSFPNTDGITVYKWNEATQKWIVLTQFGGDWYDDVGAIQPSPSFEVGEPFFTYQESGSAVSWTRNFTVN
jgi:hypothetical protein